MDASCGASKPALARPQHAGCRAFNQVVAHPSVPHPVGLLKSFGQRDPLAESDWVKYAFPRMAEYEKALLEVRVQ